MFSSTPLSEVESNHIKGNIDKSDTKINIE